MLTGTVVTIARLGAVVVCLAVFGACLEPEDPRLEARDLRQPAGLAGDWIVEHDGTEERVRAARIDTVPGRRRWQGVLRGDLSRTEAELSDHQTCPPGYYWQLFNVFVFSPAGTDMTAAFKRHSNRCPVPDGTVFRFS